MNMIDKTNIVCTSKFFSFTAFYQTIRIFRSDFEMLEEKMKRQLWDMKWHGVDQHLLTPYKHVIQTLEIVKRMIILMTIVDNTVVCVIEMNDSWVHRVQFGSFAIVKMTFELDNFINSELSNRYSEAVQVSFDMKCCVLWMIDNWFWVYFWKFPLHNWNFPLNRIKRKNSILIEYFHMCDIEFT